MFGCEEVGGGGEGGDGMCGGVWVSWVSCWGVGWGSAPKVLNMPRLFSDNGIPERSGRLPG